MSRLINIIIGIMVVIVLAGIGMLIYLYGFAKQVDPALERDLEFWQKRIDENPNNGIAHANLAQTYLDMGRKEDAVVEFRKALDLEPEEYTFMFRLGIADRMTGKTADAIDMFNQASDRYADGEKYASFYQIAEIYFEQGDLSSSQEYVQKAIDDNNLIWNSHYLLGRILESEGDIDKAKKEYQQAAKFKPDDQDLQDSLRRVGA